MYFPLSVLKTSEHFWSPDAVLEVAASYPQLEHIQITLYYLVIVGQRLHSSPEDSKIVQLFTAGVRKQLKITPGVPLRSSALRRNQTDKLQNISSTKNLTI